jgi:hypothetical protein
MQITYETADIAAPWTVASIVTTAGDRVGGEAARKRIALLQAALNMLGSTPFAELQRMAGMEEPFPAVSLFTPVQRSLILVTGLLRSQSFISQGVVFDKTSKTTNRPIGVEQNGSTGVFRPLPGDIYIVAASAEKPLDIVAYGVLYDYVGSVVRMVTWLTDPNRVGLAQWRNVAPPRGRYVPVLY